MRPSATRVKSLKAEIARRYRWHNKRKPKRRGWFAVLRIKELHKLIQGRHQGAIPNSEAGRTLVLVMAHHLAALPRDPRDTIPDFIERHADWMSIADTKALILETIDKPQRWKADSLAWRLRLTDADRTTLKITTIGAIDLSKAQREQRRKQRARERTRIWRAKRKHKQ
jgi:hypothetical protein